MGTTGCEAAYYGSRWEGAHQGYFSDPRAAEPLLRAALKAISAARPDVVADLGGGTGFLLRRLIERCGRQAACFVNVDGSRAQLDQVQDGGFLCLPCRVQDLCREDLIMDGDGTLMFCMRSLLHYFGSEGLRPLLRHLRRQMRPGEYFVHQTACFQEKEGRDALNRLYRGMGTGKWYPLAGELERALAGEGWLVGSVTAAPCLVLTRRELAERYRVGEEAMDALEEEIKVECGTVRGAFEPAPGGFTAYLHYSVFTCRAG